MTEFEKALAQATGARVPTPVQTLTPPNFYGHVQADGMPIISDDPVVQDRYAVMRRSGESHNMAEMLCLRRGPALNTDSTFMRDRGNNRHLDSVDPVSRQHYMDMARKAGISIQGRDYIPGLARFPGDPDAWVDSRADVERVARDHNMTVMSPTINVEAPRYYDPGPEIQVDPELVQREVTEMIIQNPSLKNHAPDLAQEVFRKRRGYDPLPTHTDEDWGALGLNSRQVEREVADLVKNQVSSIGSDRGSRLTEGFIPELPSGLMGLDLD